MNILVGYTGFVGSNLAASFKFDGLFNSKNIKEAFGLNPDLCVYSGVRAEKYLANNFPDEDLASIHDAINNIKMINPKRIVLISTIDVLDYPYGDEDCKFYSNLPYGKNRRVLEEYVENNFKDYLIVRLPGLYGINLKKNFIYDYLNPTPKLLNKQKFSELSQKEPLLNNYYHENEKGFFEINDLSLLKSEELINAFKLVNFSALNFTDSRGIFQFYNLAYLWNHINICLENKVKLINIAPEPVSLDEIFYKLENKHFVNEINNNFPKYNLLTKHSRLFGSGKYIFNKTFVLNDIYKYIKGPQFSLSVSNMAFPNSDFDKVTSFMKEKGYKGVEILPTKVTNSKTIDYENTVKALISLNKENMAVSSMQSILFGVSLNIFNKEEKPLLVEEMKRVIRLAKEINCPNLVFGCPKNRNMDEHSDINDAISFFKEVGDYAYGHNVVVALEANPVIYNTNFINTTSEAINFCKKVNSKGLKINLDLGTVINNGEDLDLIFKDSDLFNHIHISEPFLKKIEIRNVHYKLLEKIIESDYKKYVSLELKEGDFDLLEVISDVASLVNRA